MYYGNHWLHSYVQFGFSVSTNEQGLLQGWNSLLVRPEPLLIKDIKVQVNKQKLNIVRPAQMKHNNDKMTIAPMSSQPCSKPDVSSRFVVVYLLSLIKTFLCVCYGIIFQFNK